MSKPSVNLGLYTVAPLQPTAPPAPPRPLPDISARKSEFWGYAPVVGIFVLFPFISLMLGEFTGIILKVMGKTDAPFGCVPLLIVSAVLSAVLTRTIGRSRDQQLIDEAIRKADREADVLWQRAKVEWENQKIQVAAAAAVEARTTAEELRCILSEAPMLRQLLFSNLAAAAAQLDVAQEEFRLRCIPLYWDAIEAAARAMHEFVAAELKLVRSCNRYYERLKTRRHSFPPFPYLSNDLPSEETVVRRYDSLLRQGLTDRHFAAIWEGRKTRDVIVDGFASLERRLQNLSLDIARSLDEVRWAMDEGFDRMVEAQVQSVAVVQDAHASQERELAKLRELASNANKQRVQVLDVLTRQNAKLDNIQWNRRPLGSKYLRE